MQILKFDEFMRSLKQNRDTPHSLLLGAGASVESGVPSASDCIWDWKREIFLSQNPALIESYNNTKVDNVRNVIQNWLDSQKIYPERGSDDEYSFYAEKSYLIEDDRRKYFQHLVSDKSPSLGYHLISMLSEIGWIKSVWTTNFDGLMIKCAYQYSINPIEIISATADRIYRGDVDKELLCIALHGDYKYGSLKNTSAELDSQDEIFVKALSHELANRNLIVIGYSGRDKSLMSALQKAYQQPGSGRLYWCGYGLSAKPEIETLLDSANANGRAAFYVPTDGFDKTIYSIARHCMSEDKEFLQKIEALKKQLGSNANVGTSKFIAITAKPNKITDTNIYPIAFPKTLFQLKIDFQDSEKPWDYCRYLSDYNIMAVPLNGFVYAWGEKANILNICSNKLHGEILITPFTRESLTKKSAFRELLLKTLCAIVGQSQSLNYSRDKVWDTNQRITRQLGQHNISAYKGILLSLIFDWKYTYLSLTPTFVYEKDEILTSEERKQFADLFSYEINGSKPNLNISNYIKNWAGRIIGSGINLTFPINSNTGFDFTVKGNSAILGVSYGRQSSLQLPETISGKRIVLNGIECNDPELVFYNSQQKRMVSDFHPMRGLTKYAPFDFALNEVLRSSISLGVICPESHTKEFQQFLGQLNCRQDVKYNVDYVIPFPGFYQAFKAGLNIPDHSSNAWVNLEFPATLDMQQAAINLGEIITRKLDNLSAAQIDVALIYIPKEYEPLTGFSDDNAKYDLHDFVKAYAAQKNIATQFIREKTIESDMTCQILWAISLAIYVKACRIPWIISGIQSDTAFAGIGYSIKTQNGSDIIVGCSHIYSADGQGMKYKLAKISEFTLDHKKNPYLSEDEAYRLGLNIKDLFYRSFSELPKRVVIHKRTPFRTEEIKGLTESLSSAGIKDIELLEITYEDDLKCFEFTKDLTSIDGFPVRRGLCFPLNEKTIYLYTHGIAPSIRNPSFKYIQGGKTIPLPLKIVKHYGNGSMAQIATEILGLSKMNWNSFGLYSKLPCTIESSNEIARIGWLLSQYEGSVYDYRYFM
jgi:hypothetical protein